MERTVLVCDWCPHGKNLAAGRVEIRFFGGKPLVFDACKSHQRWLAKRVTPPKPRVPKRQGVGDPELQKALLTLLARNRTKSLARPDFLGKLPSHWSTAQKTLLQLCDAKQVIRTGKGKFTRYQIAAKKAGGARQKEARSSRRARGAEAAPRRREKRPPSKRAQGSNGAARGAGLQAPAGSA